jgi:hypothetical protein
VVFRTWPAPNDLKYTFEIEGIEPGEVPRTSNMPKPRSFQYIFGNPSKKKGGEGKCPATLSMAL